MTLAEFLELPPAPKGVKRIYDTAAPRGYREVCDKTPAGREEYRRRTLEVWERDKGLCCICGKPVSSLKGYLTADHKTPRGAGGCFRDDHPDNLGPAHPLCNAEKGSKRNFTKM